MTTRIRLLVLMARPAVILLLGMFAATGLAQSGHGEDYRLLAGVLVVVAGFLLFSVAFNDLADEAIDRVNLPYDRRRPLVTGMAGRSELMAIGVVSAIVALAVSVALGWPAIALTAGGLALSAGYSLRPVRLADRGVVASLVLPACYVAVPFLLGVVAGRGQVRTPDLVLLAGLYLGFVGRILLKDFRDVRGDALFGKRTFLIRHGRRWTCLTSACCWAAGTGLVLQAVRHLTPVLIGVQLAGAGAAIVLLRHLADDRGARRDEALICALAIVGRGVMLTLLAHLSMVRAGWPDLRYDLVLGALAVIIAGQTWEMARRGPLTRLTVPSDLATAPAVPLTRATPR